MNLKSLFVSPKGRIGRREFWIGFGVLFVIGQALGFVPRTGVLLLIMPLISLVLFWGQICVFSKRLHDMGRSGWMQLLYYGAAVVVFLAFMMPVFQAGVTVALEAQASGADTAAQQASMQAAIRPVIEKTMTSGLPRLAQYAVTAAFAAWLGLTPSRPEDNKYGPVPQPA